jgi:negative regulator of flagellin synthesis FlgM
MAAGDFDEAKVANIKQALAEGNYPLDERRIAESFVAIESMLGGK